MSSDPGPGLSPAERERLAAIRAAESLSDLMRITNTRSEHDAYFRAKAEWYDLGGKELAGSPSRGGLPGKGVTIDGHEFVVHGITHADTPQERAFLREHVARFVAEGSDVFCEQGVRPMYFADVPEVYEMDDYRWAMDRCRELELASHVEHLDQEFDGLVEDVTWLASQFREAAFSLIESGSDAYGEAFARALGDVAAGFLMNHAEVATAEDFQSFQLSRRAAENPELLVDLQHYYERRFLPQPVEREWLRRHDPELEVVTHARNEYMAEYVTYHHEEAASVHVIVGAAHQPGLTYYLEAYRDGEGPRRDSN